MFLVFGRVGVVPVTIGVDDNAVSPMLNALNASLFRKLSSAIHCLALAIVMGTRAIRALTFNVPATSIFIGDYVIVAFVAHGSLL